MRNWKMVLLAAALAAAATAPAVAGPEFEVRGRAHLDLGFVDAEENPEIGNGANLRRARLGVNGKINDNWDFRAEYDFAGGSASANDVRLRRSLSTGRLIIGQVKVPMGLNGLTSSNSITFIERSSVTNIVTDSRRLGISYHMSGGPITFQTMGFTSRINGSNEGDDPFGIAGRAVFNPINQNGQMLHLGLSAAYEDRGDNETLRLRERPEARLSNGNRVIDTGSIEDIGSTSKLGLEAAYQAGSFSLEAEYLYMDLDRNTGSDLSFDGFHIQASYVLTGESRRYGGGSFGGIKPSGSAGAWELAARVSTVDLIDSDITGGEMDNVTLGLNYYATPNLRFMLNLIRADVDQGRFGDEELNIAMMRTQYHF